MATLFQVYLGILVVSLLLVQENIMLPPEKHFSTERENECFGNFSSSKLFEVSENYSCLRIRPENERGVQRNSSGEIPKIRGN